LLTIGNRVLISHNVNVMDSLTHPLNSEARHAQFRSILTDGHPRQIDLEERPVHIEDDAWIGAAATVLRGVRIGKRAIVGAGSVVVQDVPSHSIVGGNPAKILRSDIKTGRWGILQEHFEAGYQEGAVLREARGGQAP